MANDLVSSIESEYRISEHVLRYDKRIKKIQSYVLSRMEERVTVNTLAELVAVTPNHLSEYFKRATGQNLHRWIAAQKVISAARIIEKSNIPASLVCSKVGIASESTMRRTFKSIMGISMRDYKRKLLAQLEFEIS